MPGPVHEKMSKQYVDGREKLHNREINSLNTNNAHIIYIIITIF